MKVHTMVRRVVPVLVAVGLFAAACGDNKSSSGGNATTTSSGGSVATTVGGSTTTVAETPVAGGSATAELFSEIGTLDPVKGTGSGGSDGQRMFAVYGALLALDGNTGKMNYVEAESFKLKDPADATVWTLKLRAGMKFSDGSTFDVSAVKANWERAQDAKNACSCRGDAATIKTMTVVDPLTMDLTLTTANAHFDKAVERTTLNYIASAQAIAAGKDMTSTPVGAGPFLLKEWIRDDRMVLTKNPDWVGKPGPYLDTLTFKVVGDEGQRVDTFTTGAADAFYTSTPGSVTSAKAKVKDAYYASISVTTGQTFLFNTRIAPFNDQRVRQAFVQAVDFATMAKDILNNSIPADNFTVPGTPWYDPKATLPKYDPAAAQKLVDAYVAEHGGQPIKFTWLAFQQTLDQTRAKFMQTALNQLKNFQMDIQVNDSATNINKVVVTKDFQASSWGFPTLDPEPTLYGAVKTGHARNYSGYSNAEADKAVEDGRNPAIANDIAARKKFYDIAFEDLARDLPYVPYVVTTNGFVCQAKLRGCTTYEDGILRWDLIWQKK